MGDVFKLPRILGGGRRIEKEPAPGWDPEMEALRCIMEWLAMLPTKEAQLRVLAYAMWRLKSGDEPRIDAWVQNTAEECAEKVGREVGMEGPSG